MVRTIIFDSDVAKGERGRAPPNLPQDDSPDLPKSGEFFGGEVGTVTDSDTSAGPPRLCWV